MRAGQDPGEQDEYYSDDEGVHRPPPEFDENALEIFCDKVEPLIRLHLSLIHI